MYAYKLGIFYLSIPISIIDMLIIFELICYNRYFQDYGGFEKIYLKTIIFITVFYNRQNY